MQIVSSFAQIPLEFRGQTFRYNSRDDRLVSSPVAVLTIVRFEV